MIEVYAKLVGQPERLTTIRRILYPIKRVATVFADRDLVKPGEVGVAWVSTMKRGRDNFEFILGVETDEGNMALVTKLYNTKEDFLEKLGMLIKGGFTRVKVNKKYKRNRTYMFASDGYLLKTVSLKIR